METKRRICIPVLAAVVLALMARPGQAQIVFEAANEAFSSSPAAVFLAGPFNNWTTTATQMVSDGKSWRISIPLADGRHFYKFVWRDAQGKMHWMNDPANAFMADNGARGSNNFLDVRGGVRIITTEGLERFEHFAPTARWVALAGDFNSWHLGQFAMVRQPDGNWLAYLPVKRPLTYKFIIDGVWRQDRKDRSIWIPDGSGGYNSFRPADEPATPTVARIDRAVIAGDAREMDLITSHAAAGDYGRAIALAQKVVEVNWTAFGSTSPLVLRALGLQAGIHKRWNHGAEAVVCWRRLSEIDVDTSETRAAFNELASYYLFYERNPQEAQKVAALGLTRTLNKAEFVKTAHRHLWATMREKKYPEAVAEAEFWLNALPKPDGTNKPYDAELTELWLCKAYAHQWMGEYAKAREAFETILRISPWPDSLNAIRARNTLKALPPPSQSQPPR